MVKTKLKTGGKQMATLEEMKRELARLQAQKEVRADFVKRDAEKKRTASQIRKLKYARAYSIAGSIARGAGTIARGIASDVRKAQRSGGKKKKRSSVRTYSANPIWI